MFLHQMLRSSGSFNLVINANATNVNLRTLMGNPVVPVNLLVTISAGVVIGSTNPATPAFDVGQFAAGSRIEIHNYGSVQGAGGSANGGAGGDAFKADYPNQTVIIENKPSGSALPGGGGGGRGGNGGAGGPGGTGYYTYAQPAGGGVSDYASVGGNCNTACSKTYGGAYACYSGCSGPSCIGFDGKGSCADWRYTCGTCYYIATAYTSGGSGGAGGAGGNGGKGRGYEGAAAGGGVGAGGSAGTAGGTNAGSGGTGGTGGTGGSGGNWGVAGSVGNAGATGNTGGSGNYGSGGGGSAGAAGSAGGAAGRYLVKGAANVTFINNGTIAGGVA